MEATPTSTGLQILNVGSDTIVNAINKLEEIHYSNTLFDYNRLKIVEYDDRGNLVDVVDTAGLYLSCTSSEMVANGSFENETGGVADGWTWNYCGSFSFSLIISIVSFSSTAGRMIEFPLISSTIRV